jgi:hypothetical protein
MKRVALVCALGVLLASVPAAAEHAVFSNVKIRASRSAQDRRLIDKVATLTMDDESHKLTVVQEGGSDRNLNIGFDDVQKVVFEVTTHMRGGALSIMVGGLAGAAIAGKHVNDYWCYLEYKKPDGSTAPYLIEVKKEVSEQVIAKMKATFGDKVTLAEFPEQAEDVDKNQLKALQLKHDETTSREQHPLPELKADKALVVVVCPPLAARYEGKGNQFKLHANDEVIAVNKMGTYSFAYLDPGKYKLVSQSENASGFDITLEAGKDYYFLQNVFQGAWKAKTRLTRNTKELVMYELNGAWYSDWKAK